MHLGPECSLDIQTCIPDALAAIHDFTCCHEHEEDDEDKSGDMDEPIGGRVDNDNNDAEWADVGVNEMDMRQDSIATAMWE